MSQNKIIDKCPWCGGLLAWQEFSGKIGTRFIVNCCESAYVSRYNITGNERYCGFSCMGVRLESGIQIECSEELYYKNRWKEKQLKLNLYDKISKTTN